MARKTFSLVLASLALVLVGCGKSGDQTAETPKDAPPVAKAGEPAKLEGKLDVAAFQGGYKIDFYEQAAKEFEAKHPALKIEVSGDPRIWEKLRPRFIAGNPPDLAFPGWGMDHWALAEEGQLVDLAPALKEKATEGDKNWGETFDPNVLKLGQLEGKQYVLPYYVMLYGWWYDPGVFQKHGWTAPKTYKDLLDLCAKIKAAGIAPLTFQGKYPYYMIDGMLLPWAYSAGGADTVKAAQNLEPGAWKSPAMLQAAKQIKELMEKGYFETGAVALSHTESQSDFLNGKAAMIPCGTWLYSEMEKTMPKNAKMEFFLPPTIDGGKGDPSALLIGIEPWMVPTASKNQTAAIEFFKYMTSLSKAKEFVQKKGTLMSILGSSDGPLPEVLKTPAAAFKGSKEVWAVQYRQWYPEFDKEIQNGLTSMLNGEATPEQFCDRIETAAEKARKDDSIKKHKL